MAESQSPRGFGAAGRVTALAASVMDLHVRIALQEVDREKRRLISGGLFLAMGGTAMLLALLAGEGALLLWIQQRWSLDLSQALIALAVGNLLFAGISLRIGGQVLKGPFLPQTLEGVMKTVRALIGRARSLASEWRSATSGNRSHHC